VSESAGWTTWVEPHPGTPEGRTAERQYRAGLISSNRIEEAAKRLFAQKGYEGTAIRDITFAAEVNVGAVTYHFGTKRELYNRILSACTGPFGRQIQIASQLTDRPALERIERLVRFFFDHVRRHPEMVPLMVREMASEHELASPIQAMVKHAIPEVAQIVAAGQREGTIRPGDPLLLALSSLAQPVYLNLARKGIAAAAGLDPNDPAVFDRVVDHCVTTVHAALERRP